MVAMFSIRLLFILFILVPFIEIYLLIEIGSVIGAPWTILFVVLTAAIGAWLVKLQGLAALTRFRASVDQGSLPAMAMVEGVFLLLAGALLLTPGFFTDFIGFVFLTPPVRRILVSHMLVRGMVRAAGARSGHRRRGQEPGRVGNTIEGEFRHLDD
ncbi:MAG: FxsA family protein [Proteobacteria bacterium]|nr:MAG: FxsA family protein [Pseudomonadota bacterium]